MGACGESRDIYRKEKSLNDHPYSISLEQAKIIQEQVKQCLCKIKMVGGGTGSGFLLKIPFSNNKDDFLPVLITNNHILDKNDISVGQKIEFSTEENRNNPEHLIIIDNSIITYTNEKFDVTIVEIKESDKFKIDSFLEIDKIIYKDIPTIDYMQKSIYIIHYPQGNEARISFGVIKNIGEHDICHLCDTDFGSSGSPIFNLSSHKVIGIHKGAKEGKNWNLGTFMKGPINDFMKLVDNHNFKANNKKKKDVNELIIKYKRGNEVNLRTFGDKFVINNKEKCKMVIDNQEYELSNYYNIENEIKDFFEIKLTGITNIVNASYMFYECKNLISLPNIDKWNTSKIKYMNSMFADCCSLKNLPDISKWNIINVSDLRFMFYNCSSLINLPNISNWNFNEVVKTDGIFYGCSSLKTFPNILTKINNNEKKNIGDLYKENVDYNKNFQIEQIDNMSILSNVNYHLVIQKIDNMLVEGIEGEMEDPLAFQ